MSTERQPVWGYQLDDLEQRMSAMLAQWNASARQDMASADRGLMLLLADVRDDLHELRGELLSIRRLIYVLIGVVGAALVLVLAVAVKVF